MFNVYILYDPYSAASVLTQEQSTAQMAPLAKLQTVLVTGEFSPP